MLTARRYGPAYLSDTLKKISKNKGIFYIAEDGEKTIGFAVARVLELSNINKIEQKRPTLAGEVMELYVIPAYRSHGVGKILMREAEKYLKGRGCGYVYLWVFQPNTNAREFYKKLGYLDRNIQVLKKV